MIDRVRNQAQGRWQRWAVLLLVAFFAQTLSAAHQLSMPIDEGLHITSGYTMLLTSDYRLVEEHPPLVKMWAAVPLLPVSDLPDPRTLPPWDAAAVATTESLPLIKMSQLLLYPHHPIDQVVLPPRVMIALLGVLLGAVAYRWATDLGTPTAGVLTLLLLTFDPNLLAHASVAGTDLGSVCFIMLALFCLHRYLRRPTLSRLALTGVTLGLAQGAKLSALLLLPIVALVLVLFHRRRLVPPLIAVFALTAVTLWAIYRFEVVRLWDWPLALPAGHHAIPWHRLRQHMASGHEAFLMGDHSTDGWFYYFPFAFLLKTPLPALVLAGWAFLRFTVGRLHNLTSTMHRASEIGTLALFPLLYGLSSLFSQLNIGYRHLLPLLPFLYVGIGAVLAQIHRFPSRITSHVSRFTLYAPRIALAIFVIWQLAGTINTAPHYLTFFNRLAGGPENGWRFLADSNTDWGQPYKALARFQRQQNVETVQLSVFNFYDPVIYGVNYEPLTPTGGDTPPIFPSRFAPPPGDYVISATTLDGIPLVDPEMYDWFRWRAPDAKIANALFYYDVVAEETATQWVAQCVSPTTPLDTEAVTFGFGRKDLRQITFDCTQSWIMPQPPGHYALHGALVKDTLPVRLHYRAPRAEEAFIARQLAQANIVYRQRRYGGSPAFALYRAATAPQPPTSQQIWAAPAGTPPSAVTADQSGKAPIALNGPLSFLGANVINETETLEVETSWRVEAGPIERPLSIMAHLLDADGQTLGVADGMGIPPNQCRPGDVIVQRHRFPARGGAPLTLRTGAYWQDDGQRWAVKNAIGADALFVILE
jgi:hypothetical protein